MGERHRDGFQGRRKYDVVRDILWLIPVEEEGLNPCRRPFIHFSGTAANIVKEVATFDITVDQWTSANRALRPLNPSAGILRLKCGISDSPKYKEKGKPCPLPGSNMALAGYVTAVNRNEDATVQNLSIDIVIIDFLGKATITPKKPSLPASSDMPSNKR